MSSLATQGNMPAILALEKIILTLKQVECPISHYQIDGVYCRSMFIPAGTVITGAIHNKENISILAKGTIRITNGTESKIISAPYIMVDKPGIKRLGVSETDVTFINIWRTDTTDLDEIEKEIRSETFDEYEQKLLGVA
jgi:hypothetical protein